VVGGNGVPATGGVNVYIVPLGNKVAEEIALFAVVLETVAGEPGVTLR
jgi:hypothetical protein